MAFRWPSDGLQMAFRWPSRCVHSIRYPRPPRERWGEGHAAEQQPSSRLHKPGRAVPPTTSCRSCRPPVPPSVCSAPRPPGYCAPRAARSKRKPSAVLRAEKRSVGKRDGKARVPSGAGPAGRCAVPSRCHGCTGVDGGVQAYSGACTGHTAACAQMRPPASPAMARRVNLYTAYKFTYTVYTAARWTVQRMHFTRSPLHAASTV